MQNDDEQLLAQAIGLACYGEEPRCERLNRSGASVFRMKFRDGARVLKVAAATSDPTIRKEAALLGALAATDVPVATIERADPEGARFGRPYVITTDEGVETIDSLCVEDSTSAIGWATRMGQVLARVHRVDLGAHPTLAAVLDHADTRAFWPRVCRAAKAFAEAGVLDAGDVERFLAQAPPDAAGDALCHADFSGKQCVIAGDRIAAVVDWAAAWIGDPAIDLTIAAAHCDLARRPGAAEAMLTGYRSVAPLPSRYDEIHRVARMAVVVHLIGLWRTQGAASWGSAQRSGKLGHAAALFTEYARDLG